MLLVPHPDSAHGLVRRLEVHATRLRDGAMQLAWWLEGDLARLRIPAPVEPARADRLWHHTCFEVFLRIAGEPAYQEWNLAPSGEWAAWGFDAYRSGMTPLDVAGGPDARWRHSDETLSLELALPVPRVALVVAMAAVIEDRSGTIRYWALRHPPGRPDFHHPDGFALELPAH